MAENKTGKSTSNADEEFSHWQLPDVTETPDSTTSNVFGHVAKPYERAQVEEEEAVAPLTMADLEQMQLAAEQEGFEQGEAKGHQQGLEKGRLEGLEQGHKEGFEQGVAQGFEEGKQQALVVLDKLNQLVAQFEQPLAILDAEVEAEILTLASSLAKSVISHELKTQPEQILTALRLGIDALPIKDQLVKIRVTADDAKLIKQMYTPEQLQQHQWQLDVDPGLNQGDLMIESLRSSIDLTLAQRMEQVLSEFDSNAQHMKQQIHEAKSGSHYQSAEVEDLASNKTQWQAISSISLEDEQDTQSSNRSQVSDDSSCNESNSSLQTASEHTSADQVVDAQTTNAQTTREQTPAEPVNTTQDNEQVGQTAGERGLQPESDNLQGDIDEPSTPTP
ncbi:flagellar assembly protein FliH [Shewanella maritima]|uniref:flagellar assembly protein FliH n=1 Tax=Shewanella maritima TaxID=2520507 RepID=UPI003734CFD4